MISEAATLASLYQRHSARLAAHAAGLLDAAGLDPIDLADDVTQDVWLWAAEQRRLPSREGLSVMAQWVVKGLVADVRGRCESPVGLRPVGAPVIPLGVEALIGGLVGTGSAVDASLPLAA